MAAQRRVVTRRVRVGVGSPDVPAPQPAAATDRPAVASARPIPSRTETIEPIRAPAIEPIRDLPDRSHPRTIRSIPPGSRRSSRSRQPARRGSMRTAENQPAPTVRHLRRAGAWRIPVAAWPACTFVATRSTWPSSGSPWTRQPIRRRSPFRRLKPLRRLQTAMPGRRR